RRTVEPPDVLGHDLCDDTQRGTQDGVDSATVLAPAVQPLVVTGVQADPAPVMAATASVERQGLVIRWPTSPATRVAPPEARAGPRKPAPVPPVVAAPTGTSSESHPVVARPTPRDEPPTSSPRRRWSAPHHSGDDARPHDARPVPPDDEAIAALAAGLVALGA